MERILCVICACSEKMGKLSTAYILIRNLKCLQHLKLHDKGGNDTISYTFPSKVNDACFSAFRSVTRGLKTVNVKGQWEGLSKILLSISSDPALKFGNILSTIKKKQRLER